MPTLDYPVRVVSISPDDRPKHWFQYVVSGRGQFPYVMLSRDQCWPAEDDGSVMNLELDQESGKQYAVTLNSYREPRIGHWEGFGWKVIAPEQPKPAWGSQEWAETRGDDLGESPDY